MNYYRIKLSSTIGTDVPVNISRIPNYLKEKYGIGCGIYRGHERNNNITYIYFDTAEDELIYKLRYM